jgi:hypothetical protein
VVWPSLIRLLASKVCFVAFSGAESGRYVPDNDEALTAREKREPDACSGKPVFGMRTAVVDFIFPITT